MIATQYQSTQLLFQSQRPANLLESVILPEKRHTFFYPSSHKQLPGRRLYRLTKVEPARKESVSSSTSSPSGTIEHMSSEDEMTPDGSMQGVNGSRTSSHGSADALHTDHVVHLSTIEHCMPRAYIRICLAYRVPDCRQMETALEGLQRFVDRVVEAKPYLAGSVIDVDSPGKHCGRAEIRFTTEDYLNYRKVDIHPLYNADGSMISYDELAQAGLPPSRLRPEDVSALPPNVDRKERSPAFRVRANVVKGGLIVSIYLHHCISDGTGFDLLTSGDILNDGFTFQPPSVDSNGDISELAGELRKFVTRKSLLRENLSEAPLNTPIKRHLKARHLNGPPLPTNPLGRGCVLTVSVEKISSLLRRFNDGTQNDSRHRHTTNSVLMALLWRHMTRARRPAIQHNPDVTTSKLMIPVDIRRRLKVPLPNGYFGAAIDFGKAELDLDLLTDFHAMELREISCIIRKTILEVDDAYARQVIAFANQADANTDVQDIQASNMDRVRGADMYITSWLKLRSYQHDLGMGLGGPEWVRKPWSRDPGSCIILPQKGVDPEFYEVVVQMTEADMARLLDDRELMYYIIGVID